MSERLQREFLERELAKEKRRIEYARGALGFYQALEKVKAQTEKRDKAYIAKLEGEIVGLRKELRKAGVASD